MMIEFFDPAADSREVFGPFHWIWMEGDELLAGPGREFGNADPNAIAVGYREPDGGWVSYATLKQFTDIAFTPHNLKESDMSTINKPYAWTCELRIPDGHRYFRDANTGRVAVADGSGATPDRTDDGVLWINPDLAVTIELRSGTTYGWIPVNKDGDDRVYSVSEYVVDVMRVVEAFGLTVELQGDMAKFVGEYEKYKARTATATA